MIANFYAGQNIGSASIAVFSVLTLPYTFEGGMAWVILPNPGQVCLHFAAPLYLS